MRHLNSKLIKKILNLQVYINVGMELNLNRYAKANIVYEDS